MAGHLLSAYRREVAKIKAQDEKGEFSEDDLLLLADVPDDLRLVWDSADQERELVPKQAYSSRPLRAATRLAKWT